MEDKKRDARGFRLFSPELDQLFGKTYVKQGNLVYRGEHCWIYQHASKDDSNGVLLDVSGARAVRDALDAFIAEAEAGQLRRHIDTRHREEAFQVPRAAVNPVQE